MMIKAGRSSDVSDQFNLSIPLNINIATYISAPEVACAGMMLAKGEKKIAIKNKKPTVTAVNPVLPPASTPAELST
jgi:hypothetical protein